METESDMPLADLEEKYRYWDKVLHEMRLLQPDEHLRDQVPSRPVVLILGSIVQARVLLQRWLGSVPFPTEATAQIIRVFPEGIDPDSVAPGCDPLPDCYVVSDIPSLSLESVRAFQNIFRSTQILVNFSAETALLETLLGKTGEEEGPLLYLENQPLTASRSATDGKRMARRHHIAIDSAESAATYLQRIPQLWPCFLAQLLERRLQSVMQDAVPRLQRWRRRWLAAVLSVDTLIVAGAAWVMMLWGWWNALLQLSWTTLPALLAMATLFVAVFVILMSLLLLWRIHRGTCALCSMAFLSCLGPSDTAPGKPLQRAFRENTRDFWQALSCRNLCGWGPERQCEATSFCQYCDQLKTRLLAAKPTSS